MTTNQLVRLYDVSKIMSTYAGHTHIGFAMGKIAELPTYPEPTKGSNYALLETYINDIIGQEGFLNPIGLSIDNFQPGIKDVILGKFKEIQSQLTEGVECHIDAECEFSDDGKEWRKEIFTGYGAKDSSGACLVWNFIRPILSEEQQAIELLKKSGYTVTK